MRLLNIHRITAFLRLIAPLSVIYSVNLIKSTRYFVCYSPWNLSCEMVPSAHVIFKTLFYKLKFYQFQFGDNCYKHNVHLSEINNRDFDYPLSFTSHQLPSFSKVFSIRAKFASGSNLALSGAFTGQQFKSSKTNWGIFRIYLT